MGKDDEEKITADISALKPSIPLRGFRGSEKARELA